MLTLLLGSDDFSKNEYIADLTIKLKADIEGFRSGDELPDSGYFVEQNLFAQAKVFVLEGVLAKLDLEKWGERFIASSNRIYIIEEKLDKRLTATKQLLAYKNIQTELFDMPHGRDFEARIITRVSKQGGVISPKAASLLAEKLGRDDTAETKFGGKVVERKEVYTLWQADNEIQKLLAYGNNTVSEEAINALVYKDVSSDVLDIVNAVGEGNKANAFAFIQAFLKSDTADEKGRIIQLNALLSEQFRSVLVVKHFNTIHAPEQEALAKTGWKSGRLFVMNKIAKNFDIKKVQDLLGKLESLDEELKTSSTPSRVLLDLIMVQLFQ